MTVAGLAPAGVLFGFGVFLISTGLFYGLPLPVQPMTAVSAVIMTDGLRPGEVAAAGMMLGVVLLVLGITGWIGRFARAIPQSVSAGLKLGLGLLLSVLGVKLMLQTPWIAFPALAVLVLLARIPRCPAAMLRELPEMAERRRRTIKGSVGCDHRSRKTRMRRLIWMRHPDESDPRVRLARHSRSGQPFSP
jgi:hypothetical protein